MSQVLKIKTKQEVYRDLIMQELELATRQGKIKWYKLTVNPTSYIFEGRYKGLAITIFPGDQEWGWAQDVVIWPLDTFGKKTMQQLYFRHQDRGSLVKLIEDTRPLSGDVVHNDFFVRDRRSFEEQVLSQLLIGRSPLD